jgi:DNA mismatch endonuclease (patch repair protein)
MDLAGGNLAARIARGRVATVAVDAMTFHEPVKVGDEVTVYADLEKIGRTSIRMLITAYRRAREDEHRDLVTRATFTFVAIDDNGRPRPALPAGDAQRMTTPQAPDADRRDISEPVPGWTPRPARRASRWRAATPASSRSTPTATPPICSTRTAPATRYGDYLPYGPFDTLDAYRGWMEQTCLGDDPLFHAVIDKAHGRAVGVASYLRIAPEAGSIEVGHINYAPALQRTRAGTEAMALLMERAFDLGYRRYEWKCDALQPALAPPRPAARAVLRGYLPAGDGGEGPQPRHRLVRRDRCGMAGAESRLRPLARSGQFRRRGPPAQQPLRPHPPHPGRDRLMDRAAIMRRVKARDTTPELRVRALLRALGHTGYRLDRRDLPGRPDIAFIGRRRAIFVHGCFWHGHDCRRGARAPKTNAAYWRAKIARNVARDAAAQDALRRAGWAVLIVWECALRDEAALRVTLDTFLGADEG